MRGHFRSSLVNNSLKLLERIVSCKTNANAYHAGQVDVGQTADQGLTQARELHVKGLVLLLYLFVLLLHVLQVLFH